MAYHLLKSAWRRIPLDIRTRQHIQKRIFRFFPFFFRHHPAFQSWKTSRSIRLRFGLDGTNSFCSEAIPASLLNAAPLTSPPVRLIAFYLPQFHPIPENDAWWGQGFTDWVNVVHGKPRFPGHYQPHLPGELGFYDLRDSAVQHRQVELARLYGVGGFAFYFYWFGGQRLLETPILKFLQDDTLDLPFCLCWANENWSRRWDGRDLDLLIQQEHSPKDDIAFIEYVSTYLRDRRYIRVDGRPLLIVYRPDLLPNPQETAKRWRYWCRKNGLGDLYLAYTQSFEALDPQNYGMDAAIEFPPNNTNPPVITDQIKSLDPEFQGIVFDWTVFPERSRQYKQPGYRIYRGVNPSWDNDARRHSGGAVFVGSSPQGYREWLENAIQDTLTNVSEPSERLVFVNAWNEWAEGAHLEPDQRYGYAHLQATRDALQTARFHMRRKLLVVSHDAQPNGAQYLALNIVRELEDYLGYSVQLVVLDGGTLLDEFQHAAPIHLLDGIPADRKQAQKLAVRLHTSGITDAIINTTAAGLFTRPLHDVGIRVITLIHELAEVITEYNLQHHANTIAKFSDKIVFPTIQALEEFQQFAELNDNKIVIRPQGLYKRNAIRAPAERMEARRRLRERLGMAPHAKIVIGVGYGDHRKGLDLFVETGIKVCKSLNQTVFVWVGNLDPSLERDALKQISDKGLLTHFFFPGHEEETDIFYAGSDVYAMTSREDPFPSVVLEALQVGVPVIGFEGAGGFTALEGNGVAKLVPAFDTTAFAEALMQILDDPALIQAAGAAGQSLIDREFGFRRYLFDLLGETNDPPPKISVIVPNYNYRRYLPGRLSTIISQTIPIYEIIILDDASTDGSRNWLEANLHLFCAEAQLVINEENSGSVFRQWLKGTELARGDFVWIAESDDLAEPSFLQYALSGFTDQEVVLSYTQSKQIDAEGNLLAEHYLDYVADISHERWKQAYIEQGHREICEALAIKNTIPNVSGAVFRREPLHAVLQEQLNTLVKYQVAGDWVTYIELLTLGRIAFNADSLNLHRRHDTSVTISRFDISQLAEIMSVQKRVRERFDISKEIRTCALEYAQKLYKQFGLETVQYPSVEKHPTLANLL